MSRIPINCPHCGKTTRVDLGAEMSTQSCDKCGMRFSAVDTGVAQRRSRRMQVAPGRRSAQPTETDWTERKAPEASGWRPGKAAWVTIAAAAVGLGGLAFKFATGSGAAAHLPPPAPVAPGTAAAAMADGQPAGETAAPGPGNYATLKDELSRAAALAEEVLRVKTPDELLGYIEEREKFEPVLRAYYAAEGAGELPMGFKSIAPMNRHLMIARTKLVVIAYTTADDRERAVAFRQTDDGRLLLHWPSMAIVSEVPLADFLAKKDTKPRAMRVMGGWDDYFNGQFGDDSQYVCVRMHDLRMDHVFYGYIRIGSPEFAEAGRSRMPRKQSTPITVEVRFPEGGRAANQVEITRFIATGWIPEDVALEPALRRQSAAEK